MTDIKQQVAQALLEIDAVGFSPSEPIRFKSGILSPVYVDNRRLSFHPSQWQTVIEAFATIIESAAITYDIIAGIAVGGVPHSSALAYHLHRPSVFVRKEAKAHGTTSRIEGGDVSGKRVLLVEDLVTTGGSSLSGVSALKEAGATITDCMAIVSYGFAEAQNAFADADVTLHTLTDFQTILTAAEHMGRFDAAQADVIRDWFIDAHGWAKRQGFET